MKFNDLLNNSENWIKEKVEIINEQISETKREVSEKINLYLESDAYEEDLDELLKNISSLHYRNVSFDHIKEREERIRLKRDQLLKKSAIAIGEGAVAGAVSVGYIMPEPSTVLTAASLSAGASATLISKSAIKIIYKRTINGYESSNYNLV